MLNHTTSDRIIITPARDRNSIAVECPPSLRPSLIQYLTEREMEFSASVGEGGIIDIFGKPLLLQGAVSLWVTMLGMPFYESHGNGVFTWVLEKE